MSKLKKTYGKNEINTMDLVTVTSLNECTDRIKNTILNILISRQDDEPWASMFPNGWNIEMVESKIVSLLENTDASLSVIDNFVGAGFVIGYALNDLLDSIGCDRNSSTEKAYLQMYIVTDKKSGRKAAMKIHNTLAQYARDNGYTSIISRTPISNDFGIRALKLFGFDTELAVNDSTMPKRLYLEKKL